jgi:hypothetical protein
MYFKMIPPCFNAKELFKERIFLYPLSGQIMNKIIKSIRERITQFEDQYREQLEKKMTELQILMKRTQELDSSSSRSWMGYQANYYFQDFSSPPSKFVFNIEWESYQIPPYWVEVSYEQIVDIIEGNSPKYSLEKIQESIKPILKDIKEIQRYLITELIVLQTDQKYQKELEEVERLTEHRWGTNFDDLISVQKPKTIVTSNFTAMQHGLKIPPHKKYETQVIVELSIIQSIQEFIIKINTLIRKIEIRSELSSVDSVIEIDSLLKLFSRFHLIAKQLRNRHKNRSTLTIEDEYDVQDLLHALLKIYFDDIRPEEWTPSYCGGSSRMDFLIKTEKIVIEVKKTRTNLEAKEIGEQLLIDIAKYAQHPDCKTLICFIYDPEGRIGNPTGLETDLNYLSTEKLKIITLIAPKF